MPEAKLPTSLKGWIAAVLSSMIGFIAGLGSLKYINKILKNL